MCRLLLQLVHNVLLLRLQLVLQHLLLVRHLALLEAQLLQLQGRMADPSHWGKEASGPLLEPTMTKTTSKSWDVVFAEAQCHLHAAAVGGLPHGGWLLPPDPTWMRDAHAVLRELHIV